MIETISRAFRVARPKLRPSTRGRQVHTGPAGPRKRTCDRSALRPCTLDVLPRNPIFIAIDLRAAMA